MSLVPPDITFVIVSYNTRDLLKSCIDSLAKHITDVKYEIIIVDNGSTDGSAEMVESCYADIHLIKNRDNRGFAKANNQAIVLAKGDFIVLLNSDTMVLDDKISELVEFMKANPATGVLTCNILNPSGSLQRSGGRFPTLCSLWYFFSIDINFQIFPVISNLKYRGLEEDNICKPEWVSGCFFCFRKELVSKVGLLDDNFFMYYEDTEYCMRARRAGYEIVLYPYYRILHLHGKSSNSRKAVLRTFMSAQYYLLKTAGYNECRFFGYACRASWLYAIAAVAFFNVFKRSAKLKEKLTILRELVRQPLLRPIGTSPHKAGHIGRSSSQEPRQVNEPPA